MWELLTHHLDDKPESTDGRREGRANWGEGAYKGESLGSIGTDVTPERVFSSRTGPRERSMEAGNRVIVRPDAAGCTRGPGGREFGCGGSVADSAVRRGVEWFAAGPGRELNWVSPRPALWQMQGEAARRAGKASSQGEEASPQGLGGHQLLAQTDACRPTGQIMRQHLDGQPGGVGGETA